MTVHFIGAGPGAADLITLRGRDLLARCPVCLYAGSTVAPELLSHCAPGARLVDTAPLTLDQIETEFVAAHGGTLIRIAIERAEPLGGMTAWRPALPVAQWAWAKPEAAP